MFPRFLQRGAVLRVEMYPFPTSDPRDKYIVLLNREFRRDTPIYHVLTTTQIEGIPFPKLAVVIPADTLSFFRRETAIYCREIHAFDYDGLAERYADDTISFVGTLPAEILEKLDAILRTSIYIAPKIAREILRSRDS